MKRKPIEIVANLLDILNGLDTQTQLTYNEMKARTGMHWETIRDYIALIGLIQNFSAKIDINIEKNCIQVDKYSKYLHRLDFEEQFIVMMFLEKNFSAKNAIKIEDLFEFPPKIEINQFKDSKYISTLTIDNEKLYFLKHLGKFRAQGILASIGSKMVEYIEAKGKLDLPQMNGHYFIQQTQNFETKQISNVGIRCDDNLGSIFKTKDHSSNTDEEKLNGEATLFLCNNAAHHLA